MYSWVLGFRCWVLGVGCWVLGVGNESNISNLISNISNTESQISNLKSNIYYLASLIFILSSNLSNAQCAMCRAALESEQSGVKAEAVNDGIVYLMIIPYVLVAVLFYFIYRLRKKK